MVGLNTERVAEGNGGQMPDAAQAGVAGAQFAGIGSGIIHEVLIGFKIRAARHDQDEVRLAADKRVPVLPAHIVIAHGAPGVNRGDHTAPGGFAVGALRSHLRGGNGARSAVDIGTVVVAA